MAVALGEPKSRPRRRKVTFDEFLQRPEGEFSEWVDGRVLRMSVDPDHQDVASFLIAVLRAFVDWRGLGRVLAAPCLMRLRDLPSGREPDIIFVAKENAERIGASYVDGPADLAVEIVSAQSRQRDRREKFYGYAKAGVREYWLIDVELSAVEFCRLGAEGAYHLISEDDDGKLHSVVLEGLAVDPAWLLQRPLPSVVAVQREMEIV